MNNYLVLLLLTGLFAAGCDKMKTTVKAPQAGLIIGDPLNYGMENVLIFPVGANYKASVSGDFESKKLSFRSNSGILYDKSASTEYINTAEDDFDIRNILFYDLLSRQSYPLLKDTLHILSFAIHKEFNKPLIFYRVVKRDINGDSLYNAKDPILLCVSELNGRSFVQVSPENESFSEYFYYPQTQSILVKTIVDSNKDQQFTNADETDFREMKLTEPSMAVSIFSVGMKDSLRVN